MTRLLVWFLLLVTCAASAPAQEPIRALLFSHSTGWRHDSIEPGIAAIRAMAAREGIALTASEDPAVFAGEGLAGYDALILLNTTTDGRRPETEWFTGARRDALQAFVRRGGGVVAIHGAADSHHHWPWYRRMIGGRFQRHPPGTPEAALTRRDAAHPAATAFPPEFRRTDEWYYFDDLDPTIRPLVTFDPGSIGEADANPNPVAWAHEFEGGRVFYTAMGHTAGSYAEPAFLAHLLGGLRWAADAAPEARPMVVVDEAERVREESPPHGRIGMSTAHRISDGIPGRTMEFRKRTLHVGAAIGAHVIDHDEVYYVVAGAGEVLSDGRTARLRPGMAAYLYRGANVGIRQLGTEPLTLIISYPLNAPAD
ncbi:ThuA domain-containing protein [Sphingosinicella sp. LHD-64]|uniref:ThuA domain-containing protein n=1 Tax=Sphingosinicella sp. LHD-64 TaxID=3072139 RepID=UPI00280D475F|nr:ThuA domain-containing protein [Sphingosinicella sp. LHD-64]MDQ8756946.1 ThuA domain-containing protein [Sphingosinicella sp. LHD-64]